MKRHIPGGIAILSFFIYWTHDLAGGATGDEIIFMRAGNSILAGNPFVNPEHMHAPLAKIAIGVSQMVVPGAVGSRLVSALAGTGTLIVVYFTILRITDEENAGLVGVIALGMSHTVTVLSAMGLLDATLMFVEAITILAFIGVVQGDIPEWVLGTMAVVVGATKTQGGVFVIALVAILLWRHREKIRSFALGVVGTLPVVYLPFAFVSPPHYFGGYDMPQIVHTLIEIPWIGGVGYAFAVPFGIILRNFGIDHTVRVLGHTFNGYPVWLHAWWLLSEGGIFLVIGLTGGMWLLRDQKNQEEWHLGVIATVLLLIFTIIPIRMAKFLVPIYVIGAIGLGVVIARTPRYTAVIVLILVLIIPPGIAGLPADPAPDTGHDDVYRMIKNNPEIDRIAYDKAHVFGWYAGDKIYQSFQYPYDRPVGFDLTDDGQTDVHVWDPRRTNISGADICVRVGTSDDSVGTVYESHVPLWRTNNDVMVMKQC